MKERKEGRDEGFDASGAIIRRSNNGTKATDVVCSSIGVGRNSLICGRSWSYYLNHVLHKCT